MIRSRREPLLKLKAQGPLQITETAESDSPEKAENCRRAHTRPCGQLGQRAQSRNGIGGEENVGHSALAGRHVRLDLAQRRRDRL